MKVSQVIDKKKLFYHASTRKLPVGQILTCSPHLLRLRTNPTNRETEDLLESWRPEDCRSRTSSWFACDNPEQAASFLDTQCPDDPKFLYAIQMNKPSRHPMALFDGIAMSRARGGPENELAKEYSEPSYDWWDFWEYLSPEILIAKKVKWPNPSDFNPGTDMAIISRYIEKYAMGHFPGNSLLPLAFE